MEIVSAINARLVAYEYDLRQIENTNPVRLQKGESTSSGVRGLGRGRK